MKISFLLVASFLLNCSSAMASRTLEHEAIINAPVKDVWRAWTTEDGFTSWAVKKAHIELRIDGEMRTSYNPQSTLNDEHTIVNRIISFEPERMLSIRNVQAPAGFKNAHLFNQTWSVIYFDSISDDRTHIRIVGLGYGEGPEWDDLYGKFKAGNQWTLDKLREKFNATSAKDDSAAIMALLKSFIGGDWVHENVRDDGGVFRVRNNYESGAGADTIITRSWLGSENGMYLHGNTQVWIEPSPGKGQPPLGVRFQSINEHGDIARGFIELKAVDTVLWDWNVTDATGNEKHYAVTMTVIDEYHYRTQIALIPREREPQELVNIVLTRVAELPEAFGKAISSTGQ